MPQTDVVIKTRDGNCPASVFTPKGEGAWPAAIFYMDAFGIRTSMREMAQRLADGGYVVLLPDLYYREQGRPAQVSPAQILADTHLKDEMMGFAKRLDRDKRIADATVFTDFLASRDDVVGERFGVTGYCMGGNIALTVAGALPERFAAIASFHGGGLASDKPDSPHLYLKGITGRIYIGGAKEDAGFTEDQKAQLEAALTAAGIEHTVETYNAKHGFAVPDSPAYDKAAGERHWQALFGLFSRAFGGTRR